MLTGVQAGKTLTGAVWLGNKYSLYPKDNHAIICPSYKIMQQSSLPKFFEIFPSYHKYYSQRNEKIQLPGCGNIFIRSADKAVSLEGMTLKSAWIDEAGGISRYAWLIAQGRTSTTKGQMLLTTRAYGFNWLKKEFYDLFKKGDPDYDVIEYESIKNPGFPEDEYYRAKRTLDPRVFAMLYQGRFSEMAGRVYEQFSEDKHISDRVPWAKVSVVLGGIDWGYTQPASIIIAAFTKDKRCYVIEEFYKAGLTLDELGKKVKELKAKYSVQTFFADPSEPMNIQTFREQLIPVQEGDRNVSRGIDKIRTLLNDRKLFVSPVCKNLIDEFNTYQYEERTKQVELKETPLKRNDHGCFGKGTLIKTRNGQVPIEEVKIGDEVFTPFGYCKVLDSSKTGIKETINFLGTLITKDHKVFTDKGFIALDTIRYGDKIMVWKQKQLLLMELNSEGIRIQNGLNFVNTLFLLQKSVLASRQRDYIDISGKRKMGKFLKGFISITKMGILSTIALIIWNWLALKNIAKDITRNVLINGGRIWTKPVYSLSNGINQKRVNYFISDWERNLGKTENGFLNYAEYAEKDTKLHFPLVQNGAEIIVKQEHCVKEEVYNLTTEYGMFFANGILVSNCDALRYIIATSQQAEASVIGGVIADTPKDGIEQDVKGIFEPKTASWLEL